MMNGKRKNAATTNPEIIDIVRLGGMWSESIRSYKSKIMLWSKAAISHSNKISSLGIVLTDDDHVRDLNHTYRGKNKPTNVLSFIGNDGKSGDVILAYQTIKREAEEQNKRFSDHLAHLIVHGILHLSGFDHENEKDANIMEREEINILKKLGFSNPYNL